MLFGVSGLLLLLLLLPVQQRTYMDIPTSFPRARWSEWPFNNNNNNNLLLNYVLPSKLAGKFICTPVPGSC